MNRRNRFLITLLSAGLTFSLLYFSVGTEHWKYRRHHWHHHDCYHDNQIEKGEKPPEDDSTI